jgi:hypothetical protein
LEKPFRLYQPSLAIDKILLEMASLLGADSELTDSTCDVGKKISMNYALQFVDIF